MKHGIPFIHRPNKRSRSVKISLDADGNVVVSTPWRFAKASIPHYVEQAREWIEQQQERQKQKPRLLTTTHVYIFGKRYGLQEGKRGDGSIVVKPESLLVSPVTSGTLTRTISAWLKARGVEYILKRLDEISKHMKLPYNRVRFAQQKTRWGSCSSDKNLNFNWKLVHAPKPVIDYVIIHELAHTKHMNHGRLFWDLVSKYDPNYPLHRGWLKRFGDAED